MDNTNKKKKILLVDDDEIHLIIAENILQPEYEITKVKSGKEALQLIYKGFIPHLVLLDILMPDMDGWETYNRLKTIALLYDVPIVFLTSVDEKKEMAQALEMGIADYIIKPYQREDLLNRIKKLL